MIEWNGTDQRMIEALDRYERAVIEAVKQVAQYITPILEGYAKTNARWNDQTGNARQSLHAFFEERAQDIVDIYLSHGVFYGVYLETRWAGKYQILWDTISAHLEPIREMLQGIFE